MDTHGKEIVKYYIKKKTIRVVRWQKSCAESVSYIFYVQQVQIEAKMFSCFSWLVNDDTLRELNMHNAAEMF